MPQQNELKPEKHHWWPKSLSEHWEDTSGHAHRVENTGTLIRSKSKEFGSIRNDNHIYMSETPSVWDTSFEGSYGKADTAFPGLIAWLQSLPVSKLENGQLSLRVKPLGISRERHIMMAECAASLILRSPSFRNRIRRTTAYHRQRFGFEEKEEDVPKNIIGMNVRNGQRMLADAISRGGKFAILSAGTEEFIFGDGFLHNIHGLSNAPWSPRCLIPLTPDIAIYYTKPMSYLTHPAGFTMTLTPEEVSFVNRTVQIYSKRYLFFREIHPVLDEAFTRNQHLQIEYDQAPWTKEMDRAMGESVRNPFGGIFGDSVPGLPRL